MGRQGTPRSDASRKLGAYTSAHRQKRRWLAALGVAAAAVVFCTVYALTMPASTLTWDQVDGAEVEAEAETTEEAAVQTASATEDETSAEVATTLPDGASVPEGYTQTFTYEDTEKGYAVSAYAAEGVVPEGATLKASLLSEGEDAYTAAEEALAADADDESDYGFAALDIRFEDAEGNEVEPSGDVYVVINADGLLPDDADPSTVTVQHLAESGGSVTVETVAGVADETNGVVAVADDTTVQAAFEVSGFSTFTIGWEDYSNATVQYDANTVTTADTSNTVSISLYDYTEDINGDGTGKNFMFSGDQAGSYTKNTSYWWNYWTEKYGGVTQGIVSSTLTDGYPTLTGNRTTGTGSNSLNYLFSGTSNSQVTAYENLNHLFTYDEDTGYYSFDSSENFATIYNNGTYSSDFTVYSTPNTGTSSGTTGHPYFLPFNSYGTSESDANYHFGMKITLEFLMPADGQVNGDDMIFTFAGDDDVWVYIDGALILDMGGIHDSNSGNINFGKGTVTVEKVYSDSGTRQYNRSETLYIGDLLHDAYANDASYISTNLTQGADGHWYLNDYTTHDFAFFYLERGAVDSNCAITFNLYTLQQNSLTVGKELSTTTDTTEEMDTWLGDLEYTFRVLQSDAAVDTTDAKDLFIAAGTKFDIYNSNNQKIGEGVVDSDGTFTLKAGQYAVFTGIAEDAGSYYVQELVESEYSAQFGSVYITVSGSGGESSEFDSTDNTIIASQSFDGVESSKMDSSHIGYVVFNNVVNTDNLSMLTITKASSDGSEFDENDTFTVYVEIDGEQLKGTFGDVTFTDGKASISVGTTVNIPVLTGAEFTIYEVDGSNYNVVYSAEQTFANADGNPSGSYTLTANSDENSSASGKVGDIANTSLPEGVQVTDATNATMAVTLTNSSYDFNTSLPINKTLEGWTEGNNYTFSFTVEEVSSQGQSISTDGVSTVGAEVEISERDTNTGIVYFNFKNSVDTGTYYFKVSEANPENADDGVTYDSSFYIVEVVVSQTDRVKTASVSNVTKYFDGTEDADFTWNSTGSNDSPSFINSLNTSITIEKTNSDKTAVLEGAEFNLYYTKDEVNYYYVVNSDGEVNWTTNSDQASPLTSDEYGLIHISGLRKDATYYLVETKAPDGYQRLEQATRISWNNDGTLTAYYGQTMWDVKDSTITITNSTGTLLPDTGGSGTTWFTFGGVALIAAAACGYGFKRSHERRDARS